MRKSLFLCALSIICCSSLKNEPVTIITLSPLEADSALLVQQMEKEAQSLTLSQAIIAATTEHPTIKAAKLTHEIAQLAEKSAWAGFLPTIGLTSSAVASKATPTGQFATTLSASQNLINLAGPKTRAKQAGIDTKIAQTQISAAQQEKRAAVEALFLNTWLKQEEYAVLKKELAFSQENQKINQEKYEAGLLSLPEYQKTIADACATEMKCTIHNNQLISLLAELEEMTGIFLTDGSDAKMHLEWNPNLTFQLDSVDTYISLALKNRLELEIHKLNYKRTRIDERFALGKTFPSLSAVGQYSYDYQPGNPDYRSYSSYTKTNFFGGLQLSWNLFDGTLSKIEAETARIKALKSTTDKEITQKKIEKEIKQLYNSLKVSHQQAAVSLAQLRASTSTLQSSQDACTVGSMTTTTLLGSATHQLKAQFEHLTHLVQFQRQFFALNAGCGYALDLSGNTFGEK
ncbi:TolC family protein [Candidatus Dependentiae bacterium]|nr:TolC family protein [Candidatus Dependentiae bacterium]